MAMKSWSWPCCTVTASGTMTTRLTVGVLGSEVALGSSHPTIAAAAHTAATALSGRVFNRARRWDSLCKKVIASPASWSEELGHVRRAARGTGGCGRAQRLQYQPQRALMLVNS